MTTKPKLIPCDFHKREEVFDVDCMHCNPKPKQAHSPISSLEVILGALALHQTISGDEVRVLRDLRRSHKELLEACKKAAKYLDDNISVEDRRASEVLGDLYQAIANTEEK